MKDETLATLQNIANALQTVTGTIRDEGRQVIATNDHVEVIKHFDQMRRVNAIIKESRKVLEELEQTFSREYVPDAMREAKVKTITLEGVGRVTVSHRFSCTIHTDKQVGHDWLKENGYGDLVTETVNSSTLAAFAKNLLEVEGKELPDEIFKVGTSPYTSITKA